MKLSESDMMVFTRLGYSRSDVSRLYEAVADSLRDHNPIIVSRTGLSVILAVHYCNENGFDYTLSADEHGIQTLVPHRIPAQK